MGGSGRHLQPGPNNTAIYGWFGRLSNGSYAPDGTYSARVALQSEGRTFAIPGPGSTVKVLNERPAPKLSSISPRNYSGQGRLKIRWAKPAVPYDNVTVQIYRAPTTPAAKLRLLTSFNASAKSQTATWDGKVNGKPAPAGTYMVGLSVKDASCTDGKFPATSTPAPGSTAGAGVNFNYLTAKPPLTPVPAGQNAAIAVSTGGQSFNWALRLNNKVVAQGHGAAGAGTLHVKPPQEGLYSLALRSKNGHSINVPLVASTAGPNANAKVLVVLPALSWQGNNPYDDDGDGQVNTLTVPNAQINLNRPLVGGLPPGFGDQASLINYLASQHLAFQLTTDVALATGKGPSTNGRTGVLLDGSFTWLPSSVATSLTSFVNNGGAVFNGAVNSLDNTVQVSTAKTGPVAGSVSQQQKDPFGVARQPEAGNKGLLLTGLSDPLGVFPSGFALNVNRYQPVVPPSSASKVSTAGVATAPPAIAGFRLGRGHVVEAGLANFGSQAAHDPLTQDFLEHVFLRVLR